HSSSCNGWTISAPLSRITAYAASTSSTSTLMSGVTGAVLGRRHGRRGERHDPAEVHHFLETQQAVEVPVLLHGVRLDDGHDTADGHRSLRKTEDAEEGRCGRRGAGAAHTTSPDLLRSAPARTPFPRSAAREQPRRVPCWGVRGRGGDSVP